MREEISYMLTLCRLNTLANSENTDEMPHKAAFHQGLHCCLDKIDLQRKNKQYILEIITRGTSIYTIHYHDFIVLCSLGNFIGLKSDYNQI